MDIVLKNVKKKDFPVLKSLAKSLGFEIIEKIDKPYNPEFVKEILEAEKNVLKYQILEGKLMNDNEIKLEYSDVLGQAEQLVRNQLAIYGIHHLSNEEIQKYAVEMLKDQEQVRQISSEVAMAKLKDVILEKASKKETKISHDEFLEELKK